ncbi:MAG: hypothetical protein CL600_01805 [Alteromonas sp.]|nr:hypothetical protein [Alteromonas sp.]
MTENRAKFGAIHGMRGIAAIGVVFFHLSGNLQPQLKELLPNFISTLFSYGYLGVPIFFVISGFVISYSTASAHVTLKYCGNFALRRSIRLDIVYWVSIALALVLLAIKNQFLGGNESFPSASDVILHMFYLQELMEVEPAISVVYWTLCLEVQFYLFYIFSLWVAQKAPLLDYYWVHLYAICGLGVYSILLDLGLLENTIHGLFISDWHYFLMGVLVGNTIRGLPYSRSVFSVWLLIEVACQLTLEFKEYASAGIFCYVLIFGMWRFGLLDKLFTGRMLMYLGTISYPLYLVHPDIGWKVISVAKKFLGDAILPWESGVLLMLGIFVSIVIAHILHVLFEVPTQRIAAKVKSKPLLAALKETFKPNKLSKKDALKSASS